MSSDYGSDISDDEFNQIASSQPQAFFPSSQPTPITPRPAVRHNALATPPSSHVKSSRTQNEKIKQPYRMTFGDHKGKTLEVIPEKYLLWLIGRDGPGRPVELRDALREWGCEREGRVGGGLRSLETPLKTPVERGGGEAGSSRPEYAPPPSSQPISTPSKSPVEREMRLLASSQPTSSQYATPPSSQPTSVGHAGALYRLPFGSHGGKTLLEVPENYIAYLHADDTMASRMVGLKDALRLYDEGKPPIARPPPIPAPSQPAENILPPSSAPAGQSKPSQPSANVTPSSSQPPNQQTEYRFDFGRYKGSTIAEVPTSYITFLKKHNIANGRRSLAEGLAQYERDHLPSSFSSSSQPTSHSPDPAHYKLDFGRHKGKVLSEIPSSYIDWMKTTSLITDNVALCLAVAHHERAERKGNGKRKRECQADTRGSGRGKCPRVNVAW